MERTCNIEVWDKDIDELISELESKKRDGYKKVSITKVESYVEYLEEYVLNIVLQLSKKS